MKKFLAGVNNTSKNMLANFKLKTLILGGYLFPVTLSIATAIFVYSSVQKVTDKLQQVEASHINVNDAKDLAYSIAAMQRSLRGYLLIKSNTALSNYQKSENQFDELVEKLPRKIKDQRQQEILKEIIVNGGKIKDLAQTVFPLVDRGKVNEAVQLWKSAGTPEIARKLDNLASDFEKNEENVLIAKQQISNQSLRSLSNGVFLSSLLSTIVAIAIGLWLVSRLLQTLNQTINAIATSSTQIAATVEQQERTASHQASSVNQTTTTMDQLSASSAQAAEQAELAALAARQVASLAMRLSEKTTKIGGIAELVTGLANQTNMLALNAAVEATRGGDSAKGFTVIATEIRRLADESKKSAIEINSLIVDIQNITNGNGSIKLMMEEENSQSIVAAINNIVTNSQQISLSAKQQALAIQQVVDAMNALNQGAAQTASGINQTKIGTQKLNEAAQNLKAMV